MILSGMLCVYSGCSISNRPRPRLGSYATPTPGTTFINADSLGAHSYALNLFETNGILYTCRGGHIDIAHLRIAADHVRYLYDVIYDKLIAGKSKMQFKLNVDRSVFFAEFTYPADWKTMDKPQKEAIADEVALELAQYFAFALVNWHEVLTYYGFKTMGLVSEFPSAFSWEDTYSNALGIYLGRQAVLNDELPYDEAMTMLLDAELERLGGKPADVARAAAEQKRGVWFDGNLLVTMHVRKTDIGLHDGLIWPMLVPGICPEAEPKPYPAPQLETLKKYGFALALEVEPREWEKERILQIVYPDSGHRRLDIKQHLPVIMAAIERQILEDGGKFFRDGRYFGADTAGVSVECAEK